jgi:hypothetical protein
MKNSRFRLFVLVSLAATSLMAGCSEKPKTVEWYMEHKAEREAKVKYCRDDMGRAASADCLNAEKAVQQLRVSGSTKSAIDTFKYQPPVTNAAQGTKDK